jgi:drug/metabolite transporter (DMT)-like permease
MAVPKPSLHSRAAPYCAANCRQHQQYSYLSVVAGSVFVYWLFVSLIPVYNKYYFQEDLFPYPIATAGIQLGTVSLLLAVWNTLEHHWNRRHKERLHQQPTSHTAATAASGEYCDIYPTTACEESTSWIGGPHLLWKLYWCAPLGVLFGLKYGVTNWGLDLVAAPTHLLLQATDLVWTVTSAWIINRERLSCVEAASLVACIAGSLVLSWHQLQVQNPMYTNTNNDTAYDYPNYENDDSLDDYPWTTTTQIPQEGSSIVDMIHHSGMFAIFINLLSPMLLGLCIATLRLACCELMRPDNRVKGTVSAVELTTLKLIISSFVALVLACLLEQGDHDKDYHDTTIDATPQQQQVYLTLSQQQQPHRIPWWQAFAQLPLSTQTGVMGGALLIAVFQVNCTALTHLTSAVSVGLIGQVKIIPQWIVATLVSSQTLQRDNLIGAALILASAATFAGSRFWAAYYDSDTQAETSISVHAPLTPESSPTMDDTEDMEDDNDDREDAQRSIGTRSTNQSIATECTALLSGSSFLL